MGTAAIFPGQGAQLVGMGKDFAEKFPAAAEVYADADQILGFGLSTLCFDGPPEKLNDTDVQQPAIFVTSVAVFRAAEAARVVQPGMFAAMAGLSLGEYTALHLSGAIPFEDALRLVYERGKLMQQAAQAQRGGMVSILGLDEDKVLALCERLSRKGRIGPANFNCPGQIVISGDSEACQAALKTVEEFGGKAIPLRVAGAFHSELMRSAAEGLRPHLEHCRVSVPGVRVISNVNAEYHGDPAGIRDLLYRQVFNPVRWNECVARLIADGCTTFWEIGPNRVLTGLMRKISRDANAVSISRVGELESVKAA